MTAVKQKIVNALWRGVDPLADRNAVGGTSDPEGWGSEHPYLTEAAADPALSVIVEIGVWKGRSTIHMARSLKVRQANAVVISVDTFLGAWDHWVRDDLFRSLKGHAQPFGMFYEFLDNVLSSGLKDYVVPLPLDSLNAARVLRHFGIRPDLIHLDAAHDYDAVMADLHTWWPVLRPGGTLIGDDYREGNDWPEVKRAFDDFFSGHGLTPLTNIADKCKVRKPPLPNEVVSPEQDLIPDWDYVSISEKVVRWREARRIEFAQLAEDETLSLFQTLERYVAFPGPAWPALRQKVMRRIGTLLAAQGDQRLPEQVFGGDGEILYSSPGDALAVPENRYFRAASLAEFEAIDLLPSGENPLSGLALPEPLNVNMSRQRRPALRLFRGTGPSFFLSPLGYELFDPDRRVYWPEASTRSYPISVLDHAQSEIYDDVVIIQDIFEGTNLSHFLFDWFPRLVHFLDWYKGSRASLRLVMGGAPSGFHKMALAHLCRMFGLKWAQFVFPTTHEVWRLRSNVYFFSDLRAEIMHPAHMAHPASMRSLRDLRDSVSTPDGQFDRVYISRGDTPLRRVQNEWQIWEALRPLGFVMVRLSGIPALSQISLIRGARVIVAPHGMGLTHIVFHGEGLSVVELHNPRVGTDAYSFLCHAQGFPYRAVIGVSLDNEHHDYTVDVNLVLSALASLGIRVPSGASLPSLSNEWHPGLQSGGSPDWSGVPPCGQTDNGYRHTRDALDVQPDNNSGWLEVRGLQPGVVYYCGCEVWIPADFDGESVSLVSYEIDPTSLGAVADLACRNGWQPLVVTGSAGDDFANFVLRISGPAGCTVYSRRWVCGFGTWSPGVLAPG